MLHGSVVIQVVGGSNFLTRGFGGVGYGVGGVALVLGEVGGGSRLRSLGTRPWRKGVLKDSFGRIDSEVAVFDNRDVIDCTDLKNLFAVDVNVSAPADLCRFVGGAEVGVDRAEGLVTCTSRRVTAWG